MPLFHQLVRMAWMLAPSSWVGNWHPEIYTTVSGGRVWISCDGKTFHKRTRDTCQCTKERCPILDKFGLPFVWSQSDLLHVIYSNLGSLGEILQWSFEVQVVAKARAGIYTAALTNRRTRFPLPQIYHHQVSFFLLLLVHVWSLSCSLGSG